MRVFQVATGEPGRDYRELFLEHDLMVLGPGGYGSARDHEYNDHTPNSAGNQVSSFFRKPMPGDRILMRFAKEVISVGQIPKGDKGKYQFEEAFRCVYGWDLAHCRRVIWGKEDDLKGLRRVYSRAKQKPSFTEVHEPNILKMVREIDDSAFSRALKPMPKVDSAIYSGDELGRELFRAGISNKNIQDILSALEQAGRLCAWYPSSRCGRSPSEHEVVSHIVFSLFLGLGWSHQQIAVEWNKVDMAFFKTTPTEPNNCVMVLEAKGLDRPLSEHFDQPKGYCDKLGLKKVKFILLTNGRDLFVYKKHGKEWNDIPVGYISLTRLQKQYVVPRKTSLIDTLVMLQPAFPLEGVKPKKDTV